ncbi:Peptidase U62 modulator of DNA gyrase [Mesotoga infera]|uniref:Peptidase U62 modulator of DNA gyrase n=1 Tax=Mesotoga infera TaxID=1236046 RepID=A0A7Z7LHA8_9BACT|nr:TldD/PmbA family protein [Mesotoga infera]SSC13958.1 Peptidase U62 modulator of DNA gyrase [Mesotoga infera]
MFRFPKGLYSDVRIEDVFKTDISVTLDRLDNMKEQRYKAAFIRVFDGRRWYYSSTTDIESIQRELERLACLSNPDPNIDNNKVVETFEINKGSFLNFGDSKDISRMALKGKMDLLSQYFPHLKESEPIKFWRGQYIDQRVVKSFYSSKGSALEFDYQRVGFRLSYQMALGEEKFMDRYDLAGNDISLLKDRGHEVQEKIKSSEHFLKNATTVKPGKYTVVLSPEAAGVFAHESFGHKSEADFMLGDETMMREWSIGKKVGSDNLSIIDDGNHAGVGFVSFDDEGTRARETYLIKEGYLAGRLHSVETAALLGERPTGNARAVNFEYEPIVRMTTTYISPGELTFDELLEGIETGIYVSSLNHGSGMSTFTLAPNQAFMIRNGRIAEPVRISVISGSVFQTLNEIEGITKESKILSFSLGGCGKMEQYSLPVGFGGPYVRVRSLNVQ